MKEIVVISGKGGTGKTSIAASYACLGGKDVTVADCDVDAADMHLLLKPDWMESEDFHSGELAVIDQDACTQCGICLDVCRFDAISDEDGSYRIDPLGCEGCGYCARVCPHEAIRNEKPRTGEWFRSNIKTGARMVHARLGIGTENSGKLVAKVRKEARITSEEDKTDIILIDGPPGIGCPVISSLSGADFAVLVTEPTVSGLHDLIRVYRLVTKFKIRAGCIVNKSDLNTAITRKIETFLEEEGIAYLASLPYDDSFTRSMASGKTIVEYSSNQLPAMISDSWNKIKNLVL